MQYIIGCLFSKANPVFIRKATKKQRKSFIENIV